MENIEIILYLFFGVFILLIYFKYFQNGKISTKHEDLIKPFKDIIQNLENERIIKENEINELNRKLSISNTKILNLEERIILNDNLIKDTQNKFKIEFQNMANEILEKNSVKITEQNKTNLGLILKPFKEKIEDFKKNIEIKSKNDNDYRIALTEQIKMLNDANIKISNDANNLANALKGDSKIQGDWGELQLEVLLEKNGLIKGIHFIMQKSIKDFEGKDKRPDCIVNLPDKKNLIIDSKVSLKSYEKYINSNDQNEKKIFSEKHLLSIKNHIKELSEKNYTNLYNINTPDYVLMFIPIETALSSAVKENKNIFNYAFDKNIVLMTPSTLIATLRTISFIWRNENQKQNALKIATEAGRLYDKFVGFKTDLNSIEINIDRIKKSYDAAYNKLDGKGGLISKTEILKKLGAKTNKSLSSDSSFD